MAKYIEERELAKEGLVFGESPDDINVKLEWEPDPIILDLMVERTLLKEGWPTGKTIEEMDPVMAQARFMVYGFLDELDSMKREAEWSTKSDML